MNIMDGMDAARFKSANPHETEENDNPDRGDDTTTWR